MLHDDAVPLARETVRDEGVITDARVTKGGPRRQRLGDYVATRSRPKVSAIQLTTRYGLNGQDMMRLFQKQFLNDPVLKALSKATNASSLHDERAMRASACLALPASAATNVELNCSSVWKLMGKAPKTHKQLPRVLCGSTGSPGLRESAPRALPAHPHPFQS